ncbi:hypothetical protein CPB84DRAFT_1902181 [Gymnopilus junonius]|uniref:Uncharacterized protein n=1 Tax=Gymnopilus junonius TaxID=109634 RepID=A0A9P5P057_GYMJU|nr:hypothetical protein CPB84DRAFT_1902181 [Gymnopilus junonius]
MTEYTTSSQAFREFMSARERTAYWIQSVSPSDAELYSPSVPPSVLEGLIPSSPPSEADSTHSTPPRMVLRYNDGRPDIPIPHPNGLGRHGSKRHQESNVDRSNISYNHSNNRARSGSSCASPLHDFDSRAPEEIRILPSFGDAPMPSGPLRRATTGSERIHEPVPEMPPFVSPEHLQSQSHYHPSHGALSVHPQQQVSFAPPHHPWPRQGHAKHPPAIVYAPAHHSQRPNYSPPSMFHHPPQVGPNGMIYSHSAPVPGQYPPAYPTPYPSVARDVRMLEDYDRTRSLGHSTRRNHAESAESLGSEKSGSTYYVLPSHGQKVHVINPSPEQSIITATSTTKSPSSPYGYSNGKKHFFQRLFHFNMFSSAGSARGSSGGGRKLSRRHSIGASGQHRVEQGR